MDKISYYEEKLRIEKIKKAKKDRMNEASRAKLFYEFIKNDPEEYEKIIKSSKFSLFFQKNSDRRLFGLEEIPTDKTQKDQTQLSKKIAEKPEEEINMSKIEGQISSMSENQEETKEPEEQKVKPGYFVVKKDLNDL